jgi:hypothetical protein
MTRDAEELHLLALAVQLVDLGQQRLHRKIGNFECGLQAAPSALRQAALAG